MRAAVLSAALLASLFVADAQAAPVPLPPVDLSMPGQNAVAPQVAIDETGDAVAVWSRFDGSDYIVQAVERPAGGTWSAAVSLSAGGRSATEPQVAVDRAGDAVAVWSRFNGSRSVVQAAVRPAGGAWSAATDLSDAEWNAKTPQVAVGPGGEAVAVWSRYDGTHFIVQAAVRPSGGAWSPPDDLSATGGKAEEPQLALDPAGNAVAVWSRYEGSNFIVQSASRPAGGSWEPALDLSASGESATEPQVTLGPGGEAVAVWSREEGTDVIVQSAARPPGSSWSSPADDLSLPGRDAGAPQVAVGPAGEAVAVWVRDDVGATTVIQSATRTFGGVWAPAVDLSPPGESNETPQVAVGPDGDAIAVWARSNGSPSLIHAAIRPPGAAWGAPARLSELGESAGEPQVVLDPAGDGIAIWSRDNGAHTIVQAAGLDGAPPLLRAISIPAAATMGRPASFSVSAFDAWSAIDSIGWTFGDQGSGAGPAVAHTYARPGSYGATVAATDALGRTARANAMVAVYPKARAGRNVLVNGRRARLRVHCPSPAGCEGVAKLIAAIELKRGGQLLRKRRRIGRARFVMPGPATTTVPLKLSAVAAKEVRESGRRGLKAQLTGPGIKHRVVALFASRRR